MYDSPSKFTATATRTDVSQIVENLRRAYVSADSVTSCFFELLAGPGWPSADHVKLGSVRRCLRSTGDAAKMIHLGL